VTAREKAWLDTRFAGSPVRGFSAVTGQALEAQFPLGLALAAPFDTGVETAMAAPAETAVVTTIGHSRGEGVAILVAEK
jgi:3-oxoacyl-[acyl-carrier-protein] synthase II